MTPLPPARMTVALVRLPTLTRAAFQAYWLERHAPLVTSLAGALGILKYVQLHSDLEDPSADAPSPSPWSSPYDGLAQVWYASREAFEARMADPLARDAARQLREDERAFMDRERSRRWWGLEYEIVQAPRTGSVGARASGDKPRSAPGAQRNSSPSNLPSDRQPSRYLK